jgi:hypothetical protein
VARVELDSPVVEEPYQFGSTIQDLFMLKTGSISLNES